MIRRRDNRPTGCGCLTVVGIFNLLFGGILVNYILGWWSINIPFWGDALIGLVVGEFALPVAIVGAILRFFGVF